MRLPSWLAQHLAALRALLLLTVALGLAYPLAITAVAQLPGLHSRADGSLLSRPDSRAPVGSRLIGQAFTDKDGKPLVQYFQSRPSAAGDGYDPTATSASNLGPEDIVDTLPDPNAAPGSDEAAGSQSLLSQVCARSKDVGSLEASMAGVPSAPTTGSVQSSLSSTRMGSPARSPARSVSTSPVQPSPLSQRGRESRSSVPATARTTPAE